MMNHLEALYGIQVSQNLVQIIQENEALNNMKPHTPVTVEAVVDSHSITRVFTDSLDAASFVDAMLKKFETVRPLIAVYNEAENKVLMIPVASF
jgi:hypothetical protein